MGHDHVAVGTGRLVEGGAGVEAERLGHVDLDVVDVLTVPDRFEQSVREAEGEDVLGCFLAEEVIDAEDLLLGERLMDVGVQRLGAGEVGAERLFHDDPRPLGQSRFAEHGYDCSGCGRGHAQVMEAPRRAGICQAHRCTPSPGFPPAQNRSARRLRGFSRPSGAWRQSPPGHDLPARAAGGRGASGVFWIFQPFSVHNAWGVLVPAGTRPGNRVARLTGALKDFPSAPGARRRRPSAMISAAV